MRWLNAIAIWVMIAVIIVQHIAMVKQTDRLRVIVAIHSCDDKWNYRLMALAVQLADNRIMAHDFRVFWDSYLAQRDEECREARA